MPAGPLLEPFVAYAKAAAALAEGPRSAKIARSPKRLISRDGRAALYRYAPPARRAAAPPVLVVYALINRPTILDLLPGRSVIEVLRAAGLDVWLLDWGVPGPEHAGEGLEEHVLGYLDRAVDAVRRATGAPRATLFGYCMGGTLSAMYAALRPEKVSGLLAAVSPIRGRLREGLIHFLSTPGLFEPAAMTLQGNVSSDALNAGFVMLRPVENFLGKYVRYFEKASDPRFSELFFAMERWLSEGAPLPGRLYREYVRGVYQEDGLIKGGVAVGEARVRAADVRCPLLVVTSTQDHLVPPESARALLELAGSTERRELSFEGGHVGLAVSPKALGTVWAEAARWLASRRAQPARRPMAGAKGPKRPARRRSPSVRMPK